MPFGAGFGDSGMKAEEKIPVIGIRRLRIAVDGDGVVLKGAAGRVPGDKVSVMFADGTLDCTVNTVR